MWAAIAAIVQSVLGALLSALRVRRLDREYDAALRGQAIGEAAIETVEIINETADARATLPPAPSDPDALSRELRQQRGDEGAGSRLAARRRRPF